MKTYVNILDGNGMVQKIEIDVPEHATQEQIGKAIDEALGHRQRREPETNPSPPAEK